MRKTWTTPSLVRAASGAEELVISKENQVHGFDPKTGKELWSCDGIQDYVVPCVVSHKDVIYCIGGRRNQCIAIRAGGRGDVTETHTLWSIKAAPTSRRPFITTAISIGRATRASRIASRRRTARSSIRKDFPPGVASTPRLCRRRIGCTRTTRDKGVIVIQAIPEFKTLAHNKLSGDNSLFNATPAITDHKLFLRTDKYLYCIGQVSTY